MVASCQISDQLYFFRDLRSWLFNFLSWIFFCIIVGPQWSSSNPSSQFVEIMQPIKKNLATTLFLDSNSTGFRDIRSRGTLTKSIGTRNSFCLYSSAGQLRLQKLQKRSQPSDKLLNKLISVFFLILIKIQRSQIYLNAAANVLLVIWTQ